MTHAIPPFFPFNNPGSLPDFTLNSPIDSELQDLLKQSAKAFLEGPQKALRSITPARSLQQLRATLLPISSPLKASDIAKKSLIQQQTANAPAMSWAGTLTLLKTSPKFLALVPFFLAAIIFSNEEVLQNIKVEIGPQFEAKVFEIGFGSKSKGEELGIAFEVVAGQPIRFLLNKEVQKVTNSVSSIFSSPSWFSQTPLLNLFKWRRQEPHTDCNIIVEDPGNPFLRDGPIIHHVPLSENESFNVIHRDPKSSRNRYQGYSENFIPAESSNYVDLKEVSLKIGAHHPRTKIYPLPFDENDNNHYLRVIQHLP